MLKKLNNLIFFIILGFTAIVSLGAYKSGTGWNGITGVPTDNSYISTTPGFNKIPMTGTASSSLSDWISGTMSVRAVIATSTTILGTSSVINNSVVTIYGSSTPPFNISMGSGIQGIISADMTSNTTPSPNVTSASTTFSGTYPAWKAFDRDVTTMWLTANLTLTGWLKYDFGAGYAWILSSYQISVPQTELPGSAPTDFTLQGSNNDADWVTLDTQISISGWVGGAYKTFNVKSYSTPYRYYKLDVTLINGTTYVAVGELKLNVQGFTTIMQVTDTRIVSIGTTTPKSTNTGFLLQVEGEALANAWGVACFGAIKSIIGSGSEVIKQGFDAIMGIELFTHHPKRFVSKKEAENIAVNDYINSFTQVDFETFKSDNLSKYTTTDGAGSGTVNWEALVKDFQEYYVFPRVDEFYLIENSEQKILDKRKELEVDKSIINITPISDNASTSPLFKLNNSDFLSIENQIGGLIATVQHQQATIQYQQTEIDSLTKTLNNLKILNNLK